MSTLSNILDHFKESLPQWLIEYTSSMNSREIINQIFQNRFLYYPGSYNDSQPIKMFNVSHVVHTYIYVDYCFSQNIIEKTELKGYHIIDTKEIEIDDLYYKNWNPRPIFKKAERYSQPPFCTIQIYERMKEYGEEHGCKRLAILFLCKDAIASYEAIFSNPTINPPYILVIQDHGFGGNYDCFGQNGLLHRIAKSIQIFPSFILNGSKVWDGYRLLSDEIVYGGMHRNARQLFIKE